MIVPIAPGGLTDSLARVVAAKVGERLAQSIVVDNRSGAGGVIGMAAAASAPADGYNLVFVYQGVASVNPVLYKKLSYDTERDFTPVGAVGTFPLLLAINPEVPAKTAEEFIALIRSQPGKWNYGSAGIATTSHLAMELLKSQAKLDFTHVPYRGESPAILDVVSGRVSAIFGTLAVVKPLADAGQVRVLGIATSAASPLAPSYAPLRETGLPDFEVNGWYGVLAPKGTPPDIVAKLNQALTAVLRDNATIEQLRTLGVVASPSSAAELGTHIEAEMTKWKRVIEEAKIAVEQ